jgi:tRNA-splicing ligase RtcB
MDEDWDFSPVTRGGKDKAWKQLGTSGGGNHFAEFGELVLDKPALGLEPGSYLALLTHSGSRGTGEAVASYYSSAARRLRPELAQELQHLAWLDLASQVGQEYWQAMRLMGQYAAANHELVHRYMLRELGAQALAMVENHHNFAWRETHDGQEVIVHRKGATPASQGVLGVVPGSMGAPGFVA